MRKKENVDGAIIGKKLTCTLSCVGHVLDTLMKIDIVAKTKKETFPTIQHKNQIKRGCFFLQMM